MSVSMDLSASRSSVSDLLMVSVYFFARHRTVHRLIDPGVLSVRVVRERPRVVDLIHGGSSGPVTQCVLNSWVFSSGKLRPVQTHRDESP